MPIQLPERSLLSFLPPPGGILTGTDPRCEESRGPKPCTPSQDPWRYCSDYGSLNHRRDIVAETSHASALEEVLEGYLELPENSRPSEASQTTTTSLSFSSQRETVYHEHPPQLQSATAQGLMPPKKRRSLQAILVPPFFQSAMPAEGVMSPPHPSSSMRLRSLSAAASTAPYVLPPAIPIPSVPEISTRATTIRNSPPSDLLDDDPFANLSPAPAVTLFAESSAISTPQPSPLRLGLDATSPHQSPTPRSPLANSFIAASRERTTPWPTPPRTPPSTPVYPQQASPNLRRPRSSGNGQARSAYARPAFMSRPSLPSLNTLADMHVIVPKVKRGRVGAKLPAEPWELMPSSSTQSHDDLFDDSVSDSNRSSTLSTIRDSRLYEPTDDDESFVESVAEDDMPDREEIVRSITPRASEVNLASRPNPLVRAQSDPTSSRSSSILSSLDSQGTRDEFCSSPEASFPPTPQFAATIPTHASSNDEDGCNTNTLSERFSRRATNSIYEDLAATLDYDYSRAVSQLHRQPSTVGYHIATTGAARAATEEEGECDFEPGTSARTIRAQFHSASYSHHHHHHHHGHQRTPSMQSISVEWTTEMDVNPLSPISTRSFVSSETTSSSGTSSEYGEEGDYLSFQSDSDETGSSEYTSALGIVPEAYPIAGAMMRSPPTFWRRDLAGEEEPESSESSGLDIAARLGQLDRSETDSSQYVSATEELVDSEGARRGAYSKSNGGSSSYHQGYSGRENGYGGSRSGGSGVGGHGEGSGNGRDGDDWNRRPQSRPSVPPHNESDTSDDSDSEDDYGEEEPAAPPARAVKASASRSGTDDDVPLAQSVPTALKAQRTIRRQIRDEREEKRRARSLRRPGTSDKSTPTSPMNHTKVLPLDRSHPPPTMPSPKAFAVESISASIKPTQPAAYEQPRQSASAPVGRPRTKTMPSQATSPFSVGELTKKLLRVQTNSQAPSNLAILPPPSASSHRRSQDVPSLPTPRSPMLAKETPVHSSRMPSIPAAQDTAAGAQQRLMHMRSFHRRPRTATEEPAPALPTSGAGLHRSATSASRKHRDIAPPSPAPALPTPLPREDGRSSLDRARSTRSHSRKPSMDRSARPSAELPRPPMPTLVSADTVPMTTAYQQRIFIINLQRYCQVELTLSSTAHDALEMLLNQGLLDGSAAGWMIFEICQDFGMERPIRSFETLSGVTNSWIADKTANVLMAKKTSFAPKLSRAVIPTSSPVLGGYVQWEYKRGKWQKRWLELREHSLWLSKRDNGKDQTVLCSLNNFDAYAVTRVNKAPKSFSFAVKSTDSLSFFESTTDYVHVFSCDEKDGFKWLENILLARSYVLYQERNILSSTAVTAPATNTAGGAALSRAGTRKRPAQPLLNLGQQSMPDPQVPLPPPPPAFEPGSLLAKRGV